MILPAVATNATKRTDAANAGASDSSDKQGPSPSRISRAWHFVKDPNHSGAVMAIFTVLIFATNVAYVIVSTLQFNILKQTLKDTETAGAIGTNQTWQAIGNINWLAQTMSGSLNLARDNFRVDQRPYITLGPAGTEGKIQIIQNGDHAGHLSIDIQLGNFGKSPGIEIGRDARIAVGSAAGRHIRLHDATDRRGRIIPPGDHPTIYAYSDEPFTPEMFGEFTSGNLLLILYGHIEYTDLLGEPRAIYVSEFCTGMVQPNNSRAQEADEDCKAHTRMK